MAYINPALRNNPQYDPTPPKGAVLAFTPKSGYVPKAAAPVVSKPFDFSSALGNEGIYQSDLANIKADNEVAQKQRDNAVKSLQFQFNGADNPFSTLAEANRGLGIQKGNMWANRAARGVQQSGGSTLAQMAIGHDYSKGLYDATNQFNSQVGGINNTLADTLRANAQRQGTALTDAYGRLLDNGVGLGAGAPGVAAGAPGAPGAAPGTGGVANNPGYIQGGVPTVLPNGVTTYSTPNGGMDPAYQAYLKTAGAATPVSADGKFQSALMQRFGQAGAQNKLELERLGLLSPADKALLAQMRGQA